MTTVTTSVDMSTALGSVPIPSPVLTASGCSAFGQELEPFVDLTAIGAVIGLAVLLLLPLVWGLIRMRHGLPMFGSPTIAQLEDPAYRPGLVGMKKVDNGDTAPPEH